ncbi:hypothetical protein [Pseudooceanicola sp.]|uniref:hypothetical protein n=1 Tax=Pseudooceanicola sp. TaxID=1914328 RepID=UPI003519A24E
MSDTKKIDPRYVYAESHGHCSRSWFVRLPMGMLADDLKDPTIWSQVQNDRTKALRRHDRLYLVEHDELFAAEARVTEATSTAAALGILKVISFPERLTPLFDDGTYAVRWCPSGYYVIRKEDQAQLGTHFGSEALAIRHLQSRYPRNVA